MSALRASARFLPVGVALLCVQLDFFALGLAMPAIARGLDEPVTDLQWVLSAYLLSLGAFVVPAGRVGDILGRRRALLIGLALFGATSLVCGLATSPEVLIASRAIQGLGAALLLPNAYALISNETDEANRPAVLGVIIGIGGIGTAAGPVVGGVVAATWGWPWVFWLNLPVIAVGVVGTWRLRESSAATTRASAHDLDWLGIVTVVIGLATLSVGIDDITEFGWLSPLSLGLVVAGLAVLAGFALVERRARDPLVHPALLRNRAYLALVAVGTIGNLGLSVVVLMATFTLQSVRGFSPAVAGLLFVGGSVGVALAGPVAGWLCSRFAPTRVLAIATLVSAAGLASMLLSDVLPLYVAALFLAGLTGGITFSAAQIGVQTVVPPSGAGEAASVLFMPIVAVGGLGIVIAAGIVDALGDGRPTMAGIDAVLTGYAGVLAATGALLLLGGRALAGRPVAASPAA